MANYQRVIKMWQRRCSIALLLLAATMGLNEANAAAKESLRRSAIVVAVERVSPAVVNISTVVTEKVSPFFPFGGDEFFKAFL
jgi:S1-C subfamily serine protease